MQLSPPKMLQEELQLSLLIEALDNYIGDTIFKFPFTRHSNAGSVKIFIISTLHLLLLL